MTSDILERTTTVTQAYVFALDPTAERANLLRSHIGGSRFAYNAMLGLIKDNWDKNRTRKEAGEDVTNAHDVSTSHFGLNYLWAEHRDELAPWWAENGSSTYNDAAPRLAKAFTNFHHGRAQFPTRKKKGGRGSVRFLSKAVRLTDSHHVRVWRIGQIKTYESTRKLFRHLERGTGRILASTITERGGKFLISFTVKVERLIPATRAPEKIIGIDVGLTTLYTGASPRGQHLLNVENPRHFVKSEKKLAHAQCIASRRQGPVPDNAPTNRWKKANRRVQKVHTSTTNARKNLIRETTTMLATDYDVIVVEDLNVKGMLKIRTLAKHISDAAWGEFIRQLEYKTQWYGSTLVKADSFYPSSKTCSQCGAVTANLLLDERTYHCEACGLTLDRDVNAATNLARLGRPATNAGTGRRGEVSPGQQNIATPAHPDEASTETPPEVGA